MTNPLITVAVPSLNQGCFLDAALNSIFQSNLPVEVFVADGGSRDDSLEVIHKWEPKLSWWRSRPDQGQAAAINEVIERGTAPYVCWLNADDHFIQKGLERLVNALKKTPSAPAAYGKCLSITSEGQPVAKYITLPFSQWMLARFCFIAQPATLIHRKAWEAVGGLDESLQMAMDYDLWWKLFHYGGPLQYTSATVAVTRFHDQTKTTTRRADHYRESMAVVRKHYGTIPLKWYVTWPFMVTIRQLISERTKKNAQENKIL